MDRLEDALIHNIIDYDEKHRTDKLQKLQTILQSFGVNMKVWKSTKMGKCAFTSLMGTEKKKMLLKLPPLMGEVLREVDVIPTQELWNNFAELYSIMNKENLSDLEIDEFKMKEWKKRMMTFAICSCERLTDGVRASQCCRWKREWVSLSPVASNAPRENTLAHPPVLR